MLTRHEGHEVLDEVDGRKKRQDGRDKGKGVVSFRMTMGRFDCLYSLDQGAIF